MDTDSVLTALDAEISRLQQVRALLNGAGKPAAVTGKRGRPKGSSASKATSFDPSEFSKPRRTMSAEGKGKIAAAQRKRWAKQKSTKRAAKA